MALQERLRRGLCEAPTTPDTVIVAGATPAEKATVPDGLLDDCRCATDFAAMSGGFRLRGLGCRGSNAALAEAVKQLFLRFYELEFDAGGGFTAPGVGELNDALDRPDFVAAWARHNDLGVCPYCDGPLVPLLAKVDHFHPKSEYPFLAITPENLVPVCTDGNSLQGKERGRFAGRSAFLRSFRRPYQTATSASFEVVLRANVPVRSSSLLNTLNTRKDDPRTSAVSCRRS